MRKFAVLLMAVLLMGSVGHFADCAAAESRIEWLTNYDQAVQRSASTSKPLILFFTGSDWCGWCKKLEKEVLHTPEFSDIAASDFVFLKVDFPMHKQLPPDQDRHNKRLKEKFGIRGFPTLVLLDEKQQKITTVGYRSGGGRAYAEYLLKTVSDYTAYQASHQQASNNELSSQQLEDLYRQARELGQDDDIADILDAGIASAEPTFFFKERYRALVEDGLINSPEAQDVRRQLLASDPDNSQGAHRTVAVIEYQRLAERLEVVAGDPAEACRPLLDYIETFGENDKDHLWRLQMTIAQTFLSQNQTTQALDYAKASYQAAPVPVKPDIETAIQQIEILLAHVE